MTKKLFYEDAYHKEFTGTVVDCRKGKHGYEVILDQTAFYPEGGGEPGDLGYLNEVKVTDTHEKNEEILHYCESEIPIGTLVRGRIDWNRRFRFMQQHSGEHILSGIVHEKKGYDNVGFHMGRDLVTVDLNGVLSLEEVQEIEKEVNEAIFNNSVIQIQYPSKEELEELEYRSKIELTGWVRVVTVPGADVCACCGMHVKSTGEIGIVKVISVENYKGGSRIGMVIGWQALEDYQRKTESVRAVSNLLSAKPDEVADAVEKLQKQLAECRYENTFLKRKQLMQKAANINNADKVVVFEDGLRPVEVREYCDMLIKRAAFAAVFSGSDEAGYKYVLGRKEGDVTALGKSFNASCQGRGGGKGNMVQGSSMASKEEIEEYFSSIKLS